MFGSSLGKGARGRVSMAAVALVACAALVACGPVKAGAAAIVGDDRITTAELDKRVAQWHDAIKGTPVEKQLDQAVVAHEKNPAQVPDLAVPQAVLFQLILFRLIDETSARKGITVSQSEVDAFIKQTGAARLHQQMLTQYLLPPELTQEFARSALLQQKLTGPLPKTTNQQELQAAQQAQQQKLAAELSAVARDLDIKSDPRYGDFDPAKLDFADTANRLSHTG